MDTQIDIQLSEARRIPLQPNDTLSTAYFDPLGNPCTCRIRIEKEIGEGASCICYRVQAQFQQAVWHPYILKEFYPEPAANRLEIIRNADTLEVQAEGDYERLRLLRERFFHSSYDLQNTLSSLPTLTDVVVAPTLRTHSAADNPIPAYILYEMNPGAEIGSEFLEGADAETLLQFAVKLTDSIQSLHETNYLYMDIKPSNLLWTDHSHPENARVMLFDFDSAINLRSLHSVHVENLRITPGLSAPELQELGTFEQDKRFLLRPGLDVYSIGCTLFWMFLGRFPEKQDIPTSPEQTCPWEADIHRLCDIGALREQVPAGAQDALCWILKSCMCSRSRKRCSSAAVLSRRLKTVLATVRLNVNRPAAKEKVNFEIPVAHLFYEHPLTSYRKNGVLSVGLWGASEIREEILKKLLSCCQMLDTWLHITVFDDNPQEYTQALCCLWPELPNCTLLSVNGQPVPGTVRRFSQPLAQLQIVSTQPNQPPDIQDISVTFLTNVQGDVNYRTAELLAGTVADTQPRMIAYADTRGDGFGIRPIKCPGKPVDMVPFGMNTYYSQGELSLASELIRLSFGVHRFYYGNPTDPETLQALWQAYQDDRYSIRSNNRFILSIAYKLVELSAYTPMEQAQRFAQALENAQDMEQLLWLEHRSWSAFMITEGYRCPDWDDVEKYAYSGKNNQRCVTRRLHPCLCDSQITGLALQRLSAQQWLTADINDFDDLDQVSLYLHRLCGRRMEKAKRLLPQYITLLEAEMSQELGQTEAEYWTRLLANGAEALPDSSSQWKSALKQVCTFWDSQMRQNETVSSLLKLTETLMKPAVDFSRRIDYKKYDLDVLQFVPELLIEKGWCPASYLEK